MQLYTETATTILRFLLLLGVVAVIGVVLLLMWYVRSPLGTDRDNPIEQPVEFDHRHHTKDDGIDCRYCHYPVERSPYAGVPPTSLCIGCHGQIWNGAPLLEPVRTSYYDDVPIEWRRVHDLADFVYFDHSAHVNNGVPCESCHGQVQNMARVYKVYPMTMGWCLDCHRAPVETVPALAAYDVAPPTTCSGCHR